MKKQKTVQIVVDNQLCSGCGTCYTVCSHRAVGMRFTTIGRLIPTISKDCVNCGMCLKTCPGLDLMNKISSEIDPLLFGKYIKLFVGKASDEGVFKRGQSGGLVTSFLSYLFEKGQIDAALVVTQELLQAKYYLATKSEELLRSQLSQYTPVDINSGLNLLKDFERVAIVGLPCHVEGIRILQSLYPSKYNNIRYIFGLICGGTLSQSIVSIISSFVKKPITLIEWRSKKYSDYDGANIAVFTDCKKQPIMLDKNIRHSSKPYLTQPRCKLCYDKMNQHADIVFGDSWGVRDANAKGENTIICRSDNALALVNSMVKEKKIEIRNCSFEEIYRGQGLKAKKNMVSKAINIYKQQGWMLPSWASLFSANVGDDIILKNDIVTYVNNEKLSSEDLIRHLFNSILKDYRKKKIKGILMYVPYKTYGIIKKILR